jgi:AraC-like DNA-binding protein
MPVFPIPVFVGVVLVFLAVRMWLVVGRATPLAGLAALCGAQSLIIALAQHYGVSGTRGLQPISATLIPPAAWLALLVTAVRGVQRTDLLHAAGPLTALLALAVQPYALDVLIPLVFAGYGGAILWWVRRNGTDGLPRLALASGERPRLLWTVIGAALIASAFSDVLIVAVVVAGADHLRLWIVSFYTGLNLIVIGGLSLSPELSTVDDLRSEPPKATEEDSQIMARLEVLMADKRPYLDPDLTLNVLARKLSLPAKQLSAAINRSTGENVSRYINGARIRAAQEALAKGQTVTQAMFAAGFNTKSNFNREFLRVTGHSPSGWQRTQGG